MKKLILLTFVFVAISVKGQNTPYSNTKEFTIETKARKYAITKVNFFKAPEPFIIVNVRPTAWTLPQLTIQQSQLYEVDRSFFDWDENQLINIIDEEFKKSKSKLDVEAFYKGKTFLFSLYGNPRTLKILSINFGFQSDFIKDFTLIENIDNRIRKEFVFKPKKDWPGFYQLPVFNTTWAIKVQKIMF